MRGENPKVLPDKYNSTPERRPRVHTSSHTLTHRLLRSAMGLGQELARERCDKAVGRGREGAGAEEGEGMLLGKQVMLENSTCRVGDGYGPAS